MPTPVLLQLRCFWRNNKKVFQKKYAGNFHKRFLSDEKLKYVYMGLLGGRD